MEIRAMKGSVAARAGFLFASGEPVHIDRICLALELDRATAELVLQKLGDYYSYERRGIRLVRMEDSWQLCSAPEYADSIRKAFEIRKPAKLSQPALEVLTMIEECGTLQVPGRPRLYRTTKEFLRAFHLNTLEDLPEMPGLENDGQLRLENDGTISDEMNT